MATRTFVHTVACIKMKLGMEVGIGPRRVAGQGVLGSGTLPVRCAASLSLTHTIAMQPYEDDVLFRGPDS